MYNSFDLAPITARRVYCYHTSDPLAVTMQRGYFPDSDVQPGDVILIVASDGARWVVARPGTAGGVVVEGLHP